MEDDEIEKMDCFMECTIDDDKHSAGDAGFGRRSFLRRKITHFRKNWQMKWIN